MSKSSFMCMSVRGGIRMLQAKRRNAKTYMTDDAAAELLQHSSKAVTRKHYVSRATNLKPVR